MGDLFLYQKNTIKHIYTQEIEDGNRSCTETSFRQNLIFLCINMFNSGRFVFISKEHFKHIYTQENEGQ